MTWASPLRMEQGMGASDDRSGCRGAICRCRFIGCTGQNYSQQVNVATTGGDCSRDKTIKKLVPVQM